MRKTAPKFEKSQRSWKLLKYCYFRNSLNTLIFAHWKSFNTSFCLLFLHELNNIYLCKLIFLITWYYDDEYIEYNRDNITQRSSSKHSYLTPHRQPKPVSSLHYFLSENLSDVLGCLSVASFRFFDCIGKQSGSFNQPSTNMT